MKFEVKSQTKSGIQTSWSSKAREHELTMAIPSEFEGPGSGFSPEDLYAMALVNCFVATFKVVAEKSKLEFSNLDASGILSLDNGADGKLWMAKIEIAVSLSGVSETQKAVRLLQKASEICMILNSTKTEKVFNFQVV